MRIIIGKYGAYECINMKKILLDTSKKLKIDTKNIDLTKLKIDDIEKDYSMCWYESDEPSLKIIFCYEQD